MRPIASYLLLALLITAGCDDALGSRDNAEADVPEPRPDTWQMPDGDDLELDGGSPDADGAASCAEGRSELRDCDETTQQVRTCRDGAFGDWSECAVVWTSISASPTSTCATRSDGSAYCWGHSFAPLPEPGHPVVEAVESIAGSHCVRGTDDRVSCWGLDAEPRALVGDLRTLELVGGFDHWCGRDPTSREPICWRARSGAPVDTPAVPMVQLAAWMRDTCGLTDAGDVICWDDDGHSVTVPALGDIRAIAATAANTGSTFCTLDRAGAVACAGGWDPPADLPPLVALRSTSIGHCGLDDAGAPHCWSHGSRAAYAYLPDEELPPWIDVAGGLDHVCGLTDRGEITCFGEPAGPASRIAPPTGRYRAVDVGHGSNNSRVCAVTEAGELECAIARSVVELDEDLPPGPWVDVEMGGLHGCALAADGSASCFGPDAAGQASPPLAGPFAELAAGADFTCAVCDEAEGSGPLLCWGADDIGQASPPAGIYHTVAAGDRHACAVDLDGAVHCWGDSNLEATRPPADLAGRRVLAVAAGHDFSCALDTAGGVVCWGVPGFAEPLGPERFVELTADQGEVCARRAAGDVVCAQLRDCRATTCAYPTMPEGPVRDFATGASFCAIATDGSLRCQRTLEFDSGISLEVW